MSASLWSCYQRLRACIAMSDEHSNCTSSLRVAVYISSVKLLSFVPLPDIGPFGQQSTHGFQLAYMNTIQVLIALFLTASQLNLSFQTCRPKTYVFINPSHQRMIVRIGLRSTPSQNTRLFIGFSGKYLFFLHIERHVHVC